MIAHANGMRHRLKHTGHQRFNLSGLHPYAELDVLGPHGTRLWLHRKMQENLLPVPPSLIGNVN